MKLNFSFKYGATNLSHSAWLPDDLTWVDGEELYQVVGMITQALGQITEMIGSIGGKIEPMAEPFIGDAWCYRCEREFKSPAALKQHNTVMHNGEGND